MAVVINPESVYAKELEKWNTPKREGGHGPNGFEPYPAMMYLAREKNGKAVIGDPQDEQFSATCQRKVGDVEEREKARREGWRDNPKEALDHYEALQVAIATAAAEAAYAAKRMTPKAQAERAKLDAATDKHITK